MTLNARQAATMLSRFSGWSVPSSLTAAAAAVAAVATALMCASCAGGSGAVAAAVVTLHNAEVDLYVSPSGSDTNGDGSAARPFATLPRVRDAARATLLKPGAMTANITIHVLPGAWLENLVCDMSGLIGWCV